MISCNFINFSLRFAEQIVLTWMYKVYGTSFFSIQVSINNILHFNF